MSRPCGIRSVRQSFTNALDWRLSPLPSNKCTKTMDNRNPIPKSKHFSVAIRFSKRSEHKKSAYSAAVSNIYVVRTIQSSVSFQQLSSVFRHTRRFPLVSLKMERAFSKVHAFRCDLCEATMEASVLQFRNHISLKHLLAEHNLEQHMVQFRGVVKDRGENFLSIDDFLIRIQDESTKP